MQLVGGGGELPALKVRGTLSSEAPRFPGEQVKSRSGPREDRHILASVGLFPSPQGLLGKLWPH